MNIRNNIFDCVVLTCHAKYLARAQIWVLHNIESNVEPTFESQLQRIKEFIAKAKRVRKKRKNKNRTITNADTTWNKRSKISQTNTNSRKRASIRTDRVAKKMKALNDLPVITPQCLIFNNIDSVGS